MLRTHTWWHDKYNSRWRCTRCFRDFPKDAEIFDTHEGREPDPPPAPPPKPKLIHVATYIREAEWGERDLEDVNAKMRIWATRNSLPRLEYVPHELKFRQFGQPRNYYKDVLNEEVLWRIGKGEFHYLIVRNFDDLVPGCDADAVYDVLSKLRRSRCRLVSLYWIPAAPPPPRYDPIALATATRFK
jgi:hypothetical protein